MVFQSKIIIGLKIGDIIESFQMKEVEEISMRNRPVIVGDEIQKGRVSDSKLSTMILRFLY